MILGAGEIIQSIKHLSYKCENLDLNFQNSHKAGMVMQSQSSCSKMEVETGESLQAYGPDRLAYTVAKDRETLSQRR